MRKFFTLLFLTLTVLSLSSCYDKVELEDRDFVLAIGIDKYIDEEEQEQIDKEKKEEDKSSEGESDDTKKDSSNMESITNNAIEKSRTNKRFTLTLSIPQPSAVLEHRQPIEKVISADGQTIIDCIELISVNTGAYLDFSQAKVVILGQELLMDKELFKETIDVLERNKRLSRKVLVLATDQHAKDILEAKVDGVEIIGYFLSNYFTNNETSDTKAYNDRLLQLIQSFKKTNDAIMPFVSINDGQLDLTHALIIKDLTWNTVVPPSILKGYNILTTEKYKPMNITTEYKDFLIPIRITKRDINTFFTEEDNTLRYNINIDLTGTINEFSFQEDSLLDVNVIKELEDNLNKTIEIKVLETYYYFNNLIGFDGFNLIDELYKDNYTLYQKYYNDNDEELLKSIVPYVTVTTSINSIGTTN